MFKRLLQYFPVILFCFGIFFAIFSYGVIVGYYKIYPYWEVRNAFQAARSVYVAFAGLEEFRYENRFGKSGVITYDRTSAYNGYTLFAGYDGELMKGYLIDMEGKVVHEWNLPYSSVWPQAPHIIRQAPDSNISWHGIYLKSNGNLLVSFSAGNFPSGGGLVEIDKDSNIIWKLDRNTHHDLDVDEQGYIYAVGHNFYKEARPESGISEGSVLEDVILKISPEGKVVDEYSTLEAINNSGYRGLLSLTYSNDQKLKWIEDPVHLNNVDVLPQSMAKHYPQFEPGDLLVSFRNINTIGVIDSHTKKLKWALTGQFIRQHDPDFIVSGNVLLFDNLGHSNNEEGRSRIIEVDPYTRNIEWSYTGSKEHPFSSSIRGKQQVLPNGDLLITESNRGRLFEVTREGRIVWEYVNGIETADTVPGDGSDKGKSYVGLVNDGFRYSPEQLAFIE